MGRRAERLTILYSIPATLLWEPAEGMGILVAPEPNTIPRNVLANASTHKSPFELI